MAEEEVVEVQEAPASDFDRTFGGSPDESSQADTPTPGADNTSDEVDYKNINIELVDINTLPEKDRALAGRLQQRAKEMATGYREKVESTNGYPQKIQELEQKLESMQKPKAPQTNDDLVRQYGYDASTATESQKRSLSVVHGLVENHPVVQELRRELDELRHVAGRAGEFVQKSEDTAYEGDYKNAVEEHGQAGTDAWLDTAAGMLGMPKAGGGVFSTLQEAVGALMGKTQAQADAITQKASQAKRSAVGSASGVTATSGLSGNDSISQAEYDREMKRLLG
jgi:hypothetical protein